MGIMMSETCWVNLKWINIFTCVIPWFFLLTLMMHGHTNLKVDCLTTPLLLLLLFLLLSFSFFFFLFFCSTQVQRINVCSTCQRTIFYCLGCSNCLVTECNLPLYLNCNFGVPDKKTLSPGSLLISTRTAVNDVCRVQSRTPGTGPEERDNGLAPCKPVYPYSSPLFCPTRGLKLVL